MEEIRLTDGSSAATVVPARGGLATAFTVGGRPILFLDEATLRDPTKNVRGGIPVLFPSPGKLQGDAWSRGGRRGQLPQHGFARSRPWSVFAQSASAVAMRLSGQPEWPWDFVFDLEVSVRGPILRLAQRIASRSDERMPFGIGFHPYFRVAQADKARVRVETGATWAWDNVAKAVVAIGREPVDLTKPEADLHLLDHGRTESALRWPDGREVRVRGSAEFGRWVIWTLRDRDFVCLEPWTSPGDALNTGEGLLWLAPGEVRELWIEIEAR